MPKINQEEYELLKELKDRYKWIARDKSGPLWVFEVKPAKFPSIWSVTLPDSAIEQIYKPEFGFIQWENKEPYNIAELIREYEKHEFVKINHEGQERLNKLFGNESEEEE